MKSINLVTMFLLMFVTDQTAQVGPAGQAVDYEGLIEPYRVINLSGAVDGLIETVSVDRGDVVREGQVVATLDSTVEKATLELTQYRAQAQAALRSSRERAEFSVRKHDKNEELYHSSYLSLQEYDDTNTERLLADLGSLQAEEQKRSAELEHDQASAAYNLRTIRSPVNGLVVERFLSQGELLSRMSQLKILKIAQLDPLRVEVILPVTSMGSVAAGMKAEVRPEAPVGGVHIAEVVVVDRVVDAASGTFGVRLELPNRELALPAGLKCKVRFVR